VVPRMAKDQAMGQRPGKSLTASPISLLTRREWFRGIIRGAAAIGSLGSTGYRCRPADADELHSLVGLKRSNDAAPGVGQTATAPANPMAWPFESRRELIYLHADFDATELEGLLEELHGLPKSLSQILGLTLRDSVVHLVLFQQEATYADYVRYYFPGVPIRRALFIRRNGPGMVFAHQHHDLSEDLRHELTHAVVNANMPNLPLWLDEGLAEYCEVPEAQRRWRNPHHVWVRRAPSKCLDVRDLEALPGLERFGPVEYESAWAWVHFLMHHPDPKVKQLLQEFFREQMQHSGGGGDHVTNEAGAIEPVSRRLVRWNRQYRTLFNAHFAAPVPRNG